MQRIATPPLEPRLKRRYLKMVQGHLHAVPKLAAGISALPGAGSAWAATQGAWRFLNNEQVTLPALMEPVRRAGVERACALAQAGGGARFLLLVHDWCKLKFSQRKSDEVQLSHETDVGYELTTALLVSAVDGAPLAPLEMHLKTAAGVQSTRPGTRNVSHLEQVLPTMRAARSWNLPRPVLHVIDREADSVDHLRRWQKARHLYLVRADRRVVEWEQAAVPTDQIARQLRSRRKFTCFGTGLYQGTSAQLWGAETDVVLTRPARKNVRGQRSVLPGPPLTLRLIVVQLRKNNGHVLAEWLLWSNAPPDLATTEQLARSYYWRWRIESFFKLLKSHGQHLESWQQQTGGAIARRLLIAAMACVIVWHLQADQSPQAQELKTILIRLSGRQMKRTTPHTAPALLAGLWILLSMLDLLQHVDLPRLQQLAQTLPYLNTT